jgi:DNA-directed RNA polymerase specialized sigma24 family protein
MVATSRKNSESKTEIMIAEASCREAMLAAIPKLRASAKSPCRNGEHGKDLIQETLLHACANVTSFKPRISLTEAKAMLPAKYPDYLWG